MNTYEFTCPDCRSAIPVTDPMREATLANGCPICGRSVTGEHFAVRRRCERRSLDGGFDISNG
ncbi:hypothetical protein C477_07538 [Haloterrigena salina JCM 13891]|uniref:Uncharacterized protein n=1 Tax=Haloterrigena salina JCM 13891 TaxID=1227488 RepID=M0CAZ6_9EURY|nr:hypothetical protein [Haloterrigena salina]ELZ19813.1 hypothetical protein C477_07538 [Haloterrigena salina JCM 13891]